MSSTNTKKPKIYSLGENAYTTDYEVILDLGNHPWANDFLLPIEVGHEKKYPLCVVYCNKSQLLQLNFFVPKETMFKNHTYVSSTTKTLTDHFYKLAQQNITQLNLKPDHKILDIGGNDGTQLKQYKKLGIKDVINVESADNICYLSTQNNVPVLNMFFNETNIKKHVPAKSIKLVNASGVFFHLEELDSVIKGINYCLSDDGVFVVQFMYVGAMIENGNFDTIYHEHLCYYTLNSITKLLKKYNLKLFDAEYSDIHSGSMIARFTKHECKKYPVTERCKTEVEKDSKYDIAAFKKFAETVQGKKDKLTSLLTDLKSQNKKIYLYSAPIKGNTLLNYMNIGTDIIDKAVEKNELKFGLYTPGSHIPIIPETETDLPDYYLLLCHNFKDEVISKNRHIIDKGVKFIVPFPDIEIIE